MLMKLPEQVNPCVEDGYSSTAMSQLYGTVTVPRYLARSIDGARVRYRDEGVATLWQVLTVEACQWQAEHLFFRLWSWITPLEGR